ncbi:hypothetical protein D046_5500B, partial [Vibrio parahaemolyticus V-223/04]
NQPKSLISWCANTMWI